MSSKRPGLGFMNPEVVCIVGRLSYTTGIPSKIKGLGWTESDQGVGRVRITTDFPWSHLLAAGGAREVVTGSNIGGAVQLVKGSETPASRYFDLKITDDADADEDPQNGDGISFWAFLQCSGLPAL